MTQGPAKIVLLLLLATLNPRLVLAQTTQSRRLEQTLSRTELFRKSENAIQRGVKYLLSRQNADGSWPGPNTSEDLTGSTALATLALLYAGESHQSPPLDRAIKFLKRAQPQTIRHATYSIALRACVYASLPEPLRKNELPADLRWLMAAMLDNGPRRGMYDYGQGRVLGGDYSNSQYGVLGVWYAAQAGLEVPRTYWKQVEDGWLAGQNADGGWPYRPNQGTSYASMTVAGAATLFITNDYVHATEAGDLTRKVSNSAIDTAMKWLADNFAPDQNVGMDGNPLRQRRRGDQDVQDLLGDLAKSPGNWIHYMLFGYERVGEASGFTRFGDFKWFDLGAEYLVGSQQYDGSWIGDGRVGTEGNTAYALLFLTRGRAPVIAQKLQFDGRWNNRPRDVSSFTYFMRRASERHVNWQIVSLDATPAELREAPMLYLASDRALKLDEKQKAKLKAYIDQGGLLVAVNEGRVEEFARSLTSLGEELYPAYKFRSLPEDHPVYTANFPANKTEVIRGLSNGLRELIVLYPSGDMSLRWHSNSGVFRPRNSPYSSLANLWLYVTDRANPRFKGEDTWVDLNAGVTATRQARVARIQHDGNWNPEPGGWRRLTNVLHNFDQLDLTVQATTNPQGVTLAHLTDTGSVNLPAATEANLRTYVGGGGLLLLEAAGGSSEAAGSLDLLVKKLFPGAIIAPLNLDHPIYNAQPFGGLQIDSVQYRRSQNLRPDRTPRLRGASVGGKLVAIISNEDLSGGLVGYSTGGLTGYTSNSATELMRNIILWRSASSRQ